MIDARKIIGDKDRDRYHLGQHPQMAERNCNDGDLKVLELCFRKDCFNRLRQGGKVAFLWFCSAGKHRAVFAARLMAA